MIDFELSPPTHNLKAMVHGVAEGVMRPITPDRFSVNQRLPSGPAVIQYGLALGVANSVMAWVVGLISAILPAACSGNQPDCSTAMFEWST